MEKLLDPVVACFVLGALAGLFRSELRIPASFYNTLSIYLLLAIGIKGGIELFHHDVASLLLPVIGTIFLGLLIPSIAFVVLKRFGKFDRQNAISIAAHYGSVSAVTYAVVISYLDSNGIPFENYATVLLVVMEIPAIAWGVFLAGKKRASGQTSFKAVIHELVFGKTNLLLIGGIVVGIMTAYSNSGDVKFFFIDLFKGFLCIFMLEMGYVASERFGDLKKVGVFLFLFGIIMPLLSSALGILIAYSTGLSIGGAVVLATLSASASYIAAPAAMRMVLPMANPTYSLTLSLGITFPFNILIGISLYHLMASTFYSWML